MHRSIRPAVAAVAVTLAVIGCKTPSASPVEAELKSSEAAESPRGQELLRLLKQRSLAYFVDGYAHGLYLDKMSNRPEDKPSPEAGMASIATTGYGMAIIANAARSGEFPKEEAARRTKESLDALEAMLNDPTMHHHGWLYHFVTASAKPQRFGACEYSTIDTALLYWGASYAVKLMADMGYDHTAQLERLMAKMDFSVMLSNGGQKPSKKVMAMGYKDGRFEPADWEGYNETPILVLLGLGLGKLDPSAWWSWKRQSVKTPFGDIMAGDESLFMHQYMQLYLGRAKVDDGYPSYFDNSVRATLYNKWFTEQPKYAPLYQGLWGLSAAPMPGDGYFAYGPRDRAPPRSNDHDGTVCLSVSFSSLFLAPDVVVDSFLSMIDRYGRDYLIGRYGFYESFNPSQKSFGAKGWRADMIIGISVATVYQSIVALDPETDFATDFQKLEFVEKALKSISASREHYAPN